MDDIAEDINELPAEAGSESRVLADILAWSETCPGWQRDALRRIFTKGVLDDNDFDELTALCKNKGDGGTPLAAEHISHRGATVATVNLGAIQGVENINALKPGERLTFCKKGMTIVYGGNGSGKSGYARILKGVCRARVPPEDREVLPNIYGDTTGPQKAVIKFSVNGQNKICDWTIGDAGDPSLYLVSVFDSGSAGIHVDEANDIAYMPFPILALERLVGACKQVKERIDEEIRLLKQQTPESVSPSGYHSGTAVRELLSELSGETKESDVHRLATLSEEEKARLNMLRSGMGSVATVHQAETLKSQLEGINAAFENLQEAVADEQVNRLIELYQSYRATQDAASVAARDLFANEPLPDVGSDTWKTLWEAARIYSEKQAYPGVSFPMTEGDVRCVLCQQELGAEAIDRFMRFDDFIKDEISRSAERARSAYESAVNELTSANDSASNVLDKVTLIRDVSGSDELAKMARQSAITMQQRLQAILRDHTTEGGTRLFPVAEAWPAEAVIASIARISERIAALRATEESEGREEIPTDLEELKDREKLSMVQEDVIADINRKKEISALEDAKRGGTATNRTTIKSGEVAEHLVTGALRDRFADEIKKLDIASLQVNLQKINPAYGVTRFKITLSRRPDMAVGKILSEGERRSIALAAFLTDLATTESRSAIVFDDPVSSLDYEYSEVFAKRLAEEANRRQVVIFTHDITFLFLLCEACRDQGTQMSSRGLTRLDDYSGCVQQDPPANAQTVEEIISSMREDLNNKSCLYGLDQAGWESAAASFRSRLRSTWERAVEEALSPVIKRLSNKVNTRRLAEITPLNMDDCKKMRAAYARCSELVHSSPPTLPSSLGPDKIQGEIDVLSGWVKDIKERQRRIKSD